MKIQPSRLLFWAVLPFVVVYATMFAVIMLTFEFLVFLSDKLKKQKGGD